MAVKLADTLKPMGDFPAAQSSDVSIEVGGAQKSIQEAYDDGDLGGGGASIQYAELPKGTEALVGKVYQYVGDTTMAYRNGFFYKCGPSYIPPEGYTCYGVEIPAVGIRSFLYLKGEPETPTPEDLFGNPEKYMFPVSDSSGFVLAAEMLSGEITNLVIDGDSISFTCKDEDCQGNVYDPVNHLDDYWCWTLDLNERGMPGAYYFFYALKSQPVSAENLYLSSNSFMSLSQSDEGFILASSMTTISNIRVEDGVLMFHGGDIGDCVCFPYEEYSWSQVVSSPLDSEFDLKPAKGSDNLMKSNAIYESIAKVNEFTGDYSWVNSSIGGVTHAVAFNNLGLVGNLSGNYTMLYTYNMGSGTSMSGAGAIVASCVHKGRLYFSDGTPGGLYKLQGASAVKISAVDGYSIVALESFKGVIVFAATDSTSQKLYRLIDEETISSLPHYAGQGVTCLRKIAANELLIGTFRGMYYTRDFVTFSYSEPSALKLLKIVEISPAFETPYDSYASSWCFIKAVNSEGVPSIWRKEPSIVPHEINVPNELKGAGCFVQLPDGRIAAANKSVWAFKLNYYGQWPSSMDEYELVYDGEADEHEVSFMIVTHDETGSKALSVFKTGKGHAKLDAESSEFVEKLALGENLLKATLDYVGESEWSVDKSPSDLNYAFTQKIPIHLTLKNQGVEIPVLNVNVNGSPNIYTAVGSGIIRKDGVNKVVSVILSGTNNYWESVEIVESDFRGSFVGKELEYNLYSWSDTKEEGDGVSYDFTITEDGWYCVDVTLTNAAAVSNSFSLRDFDGVTTEAHSLFKVEYANTGAFRISQIMPLKAGNYRYIHAGVGTLSVYMNRRDFA